METPHRARREATAAPAKDRARVDLGRLGDEALSFARWFRSSRFDLMGAFYGDLKEDPDLRDRPAIEDRFRRALAHGKRVLRLRLVVTILLAMGAVATASTALARMLWVPTLYVDDVQVALALLDRSAAIAGSATLLLVGLRLLFDRYLDMVTTSATFLAMQLASCRGLPPGRA